MELTWLNTRKKWQLMKQQWHNYIIEMKGKKKTCQNHYYFINLRITIWNGFTEHLQTQIDATSICLKWTIHVTRFDQRMWYKTSLVYCLHRNKLNLSKMKKTTYVSVPLGPKVWNQNKGSNKGNWCLLTNEKGGQKQDFYMPEKCLSLQLKR